MFKRKLPIIYSVLIGAWALVIAWQAGEHSRVRQSARDEVIKDARLFSNTLGVYMRFQRRFGSLILQQRDRLESGLNELIKPGELNVKVNGIALLNAAGDVVASVGTPIDTEDFEAKGAGISWADNTVTIASVMDLGTNVTSVVEPASTNRPAPPPFLPPGEEGRPRAGESEPPGSESERRSGAGERRGGNDDRPRDADNRPREGDGRRRGFRPWWLRDLSEEEYRAALEKQSIHSFVVVLSTDRMRAAIHQDFWLRAIISVLASVSVVGLGLAWRNLAKSSELELRLVRASELNARLKEMNLAAAGLAHETRNPLNIVRGMAQMISREPEATPEIRRKSREIIDESDRVTAQLNEFINYSRPREVRRTTVMLGSVVNELIRALSSDIEDKLVRIEAAPDLPAIEADEQLLRQALFNLLLNALQAVERGGEIHVVAQKTGANEGQFEIRDNGPGVSAEHRSEIFKPYFTTQLKGTGLGLAVVHQIVLAHGWEIACLDNEPRGAVFRITHLRLASA